MPTKKTLGAIAFVAALAGGGVAGALLATPSLTAAQEAEDPTDGTTTATTTDESTSDDRERCGPGGGHGANLAAAAEAIGVSAEELRAALADGQSIAQVAEANGVDVQTVIDALVTDATARIDEKVAAGDITAEEAEERKAELSDRITDLVNREGLAPRGPHGPGRPGRFGAPDESEDESQGS